MRPGCVGIHGVLYDASSFASLHPGGALFVHLVEGTDATALFESHHVHIERAQRALAQLPVVGTFQPVVDYDFTEYGTLRQRALTLFPTRASRRMSSVDRAALLLLCGVTLSAHVATLFATAWTATWTLALLSSAVLSTVCGGYGHNALHVLDPFAVLLDWNGLSSFEWLLEHVQSHHPHVNTVYDHDALSMEPFVRWLPSRPRGWLGSYTKHLLYLVSEIVVATQGVLGLRARWRVEHAPWWMAWAPWLFVLRLATWVSAHGLVDGAATALLVVGAAGYYFASLAHLSHGYGGDGRPNFAAHQLLNTRDLDFPGPLSLFLDRQTVHHLFPSIDHTRWSWEQRQAMCDDRLCAPTSSARLEQWVDAVVAAK